MLAALTSTCPLQAQLLLSDFQLRRQASPVSPLAGGGRPRTCCSPPPAASSPTSGSLCRANSSLGKEKNFLKFFYLT